VGNFEIGAKQRLFRNARQSRGDLFLLFRGRRAYIQNIDLYLRLRR